MVGAAGNAALADSTEVDAMKFKPTIAVAVLTPVMLAAPAALPQASAAPHAAAARHCTYPPGTSHLTISVQKTRIHPGQHDRVFGTLYRHHCVVKGGWVHIKRDGNHVATRKTDGHGGYEYNFRLHKRGTYAFRAYFYGNKQADSAVSRTVRIHVVKKHHHHKKHH
jgi:hypothetical protein